MKSFLMLISLVTLTLSLNAFAETTLVPITDDPGANTASLVTSVKRLFDKKADTEIWVHTLISGSDANPINLIVSIPNGEGDRGSDVFSIFANLTDIRSISLVKGKLVVVGSRNSYEESGGPTLQSVTFTINYKDSSGKIAKTLEVTEKVTRQK